MMAPPAAPPWDVAISLLETDLVHARQIARLLKDRARVFIYADHQDLLVGSDGVETFGNVFGRDATLVVVLYRADWGETGWTAIEKSAINSRRVNETTDEFLTVVKMVDVATPSWLPTSRIYGKWQQLGARGVAGAITVRLQELGTSVRPETPADVARRIADAKAWEQQRQRFLNDQGWEQAGFEIESIFGEMKRFSADAQCQYFRDNSSATVLRDGFISTVARASSRELVMKLWRGELLSSSMPVGTTLMTKRLTFDIEPPGVLGWRVGNSSDFLTSGKVAETAVMQLLARLDSQRSRVNR